MSSKGRWVHEVPESEAPRGGWSTRFPCRKTEGEASGPGAGSSLGWSQVDSMTTESDISNPDLPIPR
jgi:hypothetical protein